MSSVLPRSASPFFVVGVFTATCVALTALLNIVVLVVPFDNPAMGLIIVFAAAGVAAHAWVGREKATPSSRRAWVCALLCGIVSGLLASGLAAFNLSGDSQLWRELTSTGALTIVTVFLAIVVIQTLSARFGFWLTFRQLAKTAASS